MLMADIEAVSGAACRGQVSRAWSWLHFDGCADHTVKDTFHVLVF